MEYAPDGGPELAPGQVTHRTFLAVIDVLEFAPAAEKDGWPDYPFSFHDSEELGLAILAKISKRTSEACATLAPSPVLGSFGRITHHSGVEAGRSS